MKLGLKIQQTSLNLGQKKYNIHTLGNKFFDNAYRRIQRNMNSNNSANGIINDNNSVLSYQEPIGRHENTYSKIAKRNLSAIEKYRIPNKKCA
jgi:hypothetical protein